MLILVSTSVSSPVKEKRIAVVGSSVATGWVTTYHNEMDMRGGWARWMSRAMLDREWATINLSSPGDTTERVLDRLDEELFPLGVDVVIISLSLENEGIRKENPDAVFNKYMKNLKLIVDKCKTNDVIPVIGLCYANNQFEKKHYEYIKKANGIISEWDVESIDLLGALNNGNGKFPKGYNFDGDHPNTLGHLEMYHAIVPTLFDALLEKKNPQTHKPKLNGFHRFVEGEHSSTLSFIPDGIMHSFTISLNINMKSAGNLVTVRTDGKSAVLELMQDNKLVYTSPDGKKYTSEKPVIIKDWASLSIVNRYATGDLLVYSNGKQLLKASVKMSPFNIIIGGKSAFDLKEIFIHRSALNANDVGMINLGGFPRSSLEVYSNFTGTQFKAGEKLVNFAMSKSALIFNSDDRADEIAALKKKHQAIEEWKNEREQKTKPTLKLDNSVLDSYTGDYELQKGVIFKISREESVLYLSDPRGMKVELVPLTDTRFKAKIPGVKIEISFEKSKDGKIINLVMHDSQGEMKAKKVK